MGLHDGLSQVSANLEILTDNIRQAKPCQNLPQVSSKKDLLERVGRMGCNLPSQYTAHLWDPARQYLWSSDSALFNPFLISPMGDFASPDRQSTIKLARDVSQAVLQHSNNFAWNQTAPLQQLACDMWNTFVSSSGHCSTDHCLPPIVIWGNEDGEFARPKHPVRSLLGNAVPIVSFNAAFMNEGILAWPVMMHETAHTILESGNGLTPALNRAVNDALTQRFNHAMVHYWTGNRKGAVEKIGETAADVLSVLYMGPMAAVSLLARLRSVRSEGKLSSKAPNDDPHPADVLRILVLAYVVRELKIDKSNYWFNFLIQEVKKDFNSRILGMKWEDALDSAKCVARTIMHTEVVGSQSFKQVRCWNNSDEAIVETCMRTMDQDVSIVDAKAPHYVAAANLHLLSGRRLICADDVRISHIFQKMLGNIKAASNSGSCTSCQLSQKQTYQVCPAPVQDRREPVEDNTLRNVAIGVGILALLGLGTAVLCSGGENNRRRQATAPART